ncbi:MAG: acyl-CoA thioesterase [Sphingomonadaceae bacterium]|jgi:acyl-CoA thioesterase YciA
MTEEPILRTVPMPGDINTNGHIFGGWVLSQMDIAGGIIAHRRAGSAVATVAIESMHFIAPILLGDIISIYGHVERTGRTSIAVSLRVIATRGRKQLQVPVTSGVFTFVALDKEHKPKPLPEV